MADHPLFTHNYFSFMKFSGILFLVVPLLGSAYVFWRTWQLVPFCTLAKTVILLLMALAWVLVYVNFSGTVDMQSMRLAATTCPVGTSWLILLFCFFEQAEKVGVRFQLRGHARHGWEWGAWWVVDGVRDKSCGGLRKDKVRWRFATSGLGIWGGKFSIGTQSEYLAAALTSTTSVNCCQHE